ncbi:transposase [Streptomyces sp. NPDC051643]|uniref:transposase n=1 Tax=unclassified Streptomyces TaxID=2593676 RepID=UPI0037AE469C
MKYYFCKWRDDGTGQTIHDLLRWQVRESRGHKADPSLVVLDPQSLHAAVGVPAGATGRDAARKVPGRRRGLAVDVLGLVIAVVVLAASTHDNTAGIMLPDQVAEHAGDSVRKALVDQGFKNQWSWTAPTWTSTSKSSTATREPAGSSRSPRGGWWSK